MTSVWRNESKATLCTLLQHLSGSTVGVMLQPVEHTATKPEYKARVQFHGHVLMIKKCIPLQSLGHNTLGVGKIPLGAMF